MACIDPVVISCVTKHECGSQTLQRVAKQLQLYKPPEVDGDQDRDDLGGGPICAINDTPTARNEQFSSADCRKRRAAVLICLFEGPQGELRVILTKRSMKLSSYPGDVALPGGKMEEGDADDSATALREAMEEIGLASSLVQVVANLEPFISLQHLLKVIPVIGLLDRVEDFKPELNSDEVDSIFDVPLEMFLKKDNHRYEEREWMGWMYAVHNFEFEYHAHDDDDDDDHHHHHHNNQKEVFGITIRGLTASILIRAASIIYQQSPCFGQHHLPDFQQLQRTLSNFT